MYHGRPNREGIHFHSFYSSYHCVCDYFAPSSIVLRHFQPSLSTNACSFATGEVILEDEEESSLIQRRVDILGNHQQALKNSILADTAEPEASPFADSPADTLHTAEDQVKEVTAVQWKQRLLPPTSPPARKHRFIFLHIRGPTVQSLSDKTTPPNSRSAHRRRRKDIPEKR